MTAVVYSRRVNMGLPGFDALHPFDGRKYARAWKMLAHRLGADLRSRVVTIDRPVTDTELRLVHTPRYLERLTERNFVAEALEAPIFRSLPYALLSMAVVQPMRWAVRGSVVAAKAALTQGAAVHLGGGFHHAHADVGEGFCLMSDIGLIVRQLRQEGLLTESGRVAYVDLDAHQGNGVSRVFHDDTDVFLFDVYNQSIYPAHDYEARQRLDCDLPLPNRCQGPRYLQIVRNALPGFLDSVGRTRPVELAIYNAGTDVYQDDPLGGLGLSAEDVLTRDLFVMDELRQRKIPAVMLTSGGYTRESAALIAATVEQLIRQETA